MADAGLTRRSACDYMRWPLRAGVPMVVDHHVFVVRFRPKVDATLNDLSAVAHINFGNIRLKPAEQAVESSEDSVDLNNAADREH